MAVSSPRVMGRPALGSRIVKAVMTEETYQWLDMTARATGRTIPAVIRDELESARLASALTPEQEN